jgi:hypothetical protein
VDAMSEIKINDTVAIRGDKRTRYFPEKGKFSSVYFDSQLIDGKYVKNQVTGEAWKGKVTKLKGDMALVCGGWWDINLLEVREDSGEEFMPITKSDFLRYLKDPKGSHLSILTRK